MKASVNCQPDRIMKGFSCDVEKEINARFGLIDHGFTCADQIYRV